MNRYTAFLLAALVAIVVACNTDRPTSQTGYTPIAIPIANITSSTSAFKVQINGTWYALEKPGDAYRSHPADSSFTFTFRGNALAATTSSIANDTAGLGAGTADIYMGPVNFGVCTKCGVFDPMGLLPHQVLVGISAIQDKDTLIIDSVKSTHWYAHGSSGNNTTNYFTDADVIADNVGSFRFTACNVAPLCTFGPKDPTSVVLSNAVQYAKIVWSNNSDSEDSTEIYFGDVSNPTYRETVAPGITQAFETWLSGSHQYIAKIRHRLNGNAGAQVSSNTLTH